MSFYSVCKFSDFTLLEPTHHIPRSGPPQACNGCGLDYGCIGEGQSLPVRLRAAILGAKRSYSRKLSSSATLPDAEQIFTISVVLASSHQTCGKFLPGGKLWFPG